MIFFVKQKTAYEMRISDWSSDVCSSDLSRADQDWLERLLDGCIRYTPTVALDAPDGLTLDITGCAHLFGGEGSLIKDIELRMARLGMTLRHATALSPDAAQALRSEEHTSELQSLMRISYAVFCLKKKKQKKQRHE